MPPEPIRTAVDGLGRAPRLRLAWLAASLGLLEALSGALRRLLDLSVSLALSLLLLPYAALAWVVARAGGRPAFVREGFVGRWQQPIELGRLTAGGPLARLPWLWAVVRGDLALVGPAPCSEAERARLTAADLPRFQVRPGLAHLHRIRRAANIDFEGQTRSDLEQVHAVGLGGELGILVRSIPAALIGGRAVAPPRELHLLGVRIDNWTMSEAIAWLLSQPRGGRPRQLAFVNPDCLNKAYERESYRRVLAAADVVLPDGIGIHYACKILGTSLAANVNGTDLFPRLCDAAEAAGRSLYLLGARREVVESLGERIAQRWPGLEIAGARDGFFARGGEEEREVVTAIRDSGADLLLVAFGAPAQEEWIACHAGELGVAAAMGVGGLFDFYSGRIPRAPGWVREIGFEWAWRLLQEPGRMWRRYIVGNPLFLWRIWRQGRRFPLG
ncbi:MAG: WecB/TagA/CpsF family glycosyltransferase [Holophagales bacterium]|nr:MAG: WecB/TagA/CpsF family glycosyltransferase [Holophagales bacterium]